MKTFEEYLQDKHADQYQGLDDEMPDNFNEWLCDLDPDEWIGYAGKWVKEEYDKKKESMFDRMSENSFESMFE